MKVGFSSRQLSRPGHRSRAANIDFASEPLNGLDDQAVLRGVLLIPQNYAIGKAVEWRNRICCLPTLADFIP
jgi:hypothetical protein